MSGQIESRLFADDGRTPNHPRLPLIVLRAAAATGADDPAAWFEREFVAHGWSGTWRWGIYPFHHFHTTDHEVLGVSRGHARLMMGGKNGAECTVRTGDVLIIPAGVGHQCLEASADFQVVGAYPGGRAPDLVRPGEGDAEKVRKRISEVKLPAQDPVHGEGGPLFDHWQR